MSVAAFFSEISMCLFDEFLGDDLVPGCDSHSIYAGGKTTDLEGNIFRIRMFTPELLACGIVDFHLVDGQEIREMDYVFRRVGVQHDILTRKVFYSYVTSFVVKGEPVGCAGFVGFEEEGQAAGIHREACICELSGEREQTVFFRDRVIVEM